MKDEFKSELVYTVKLVAGRLAGCAVVLVLTYFAFMWMTRP